MNLVKIMTIVNGHRVIFCIVLLKFVLAAPPIFQNPTTEETDFSEVCGISKAPLARVVGGSESPVHAWPWMGAIFKKNNETEELNVVYCGGAVISHYHILTAGHCVERSSADELVVRLGEHDILSDSDGATPVDFQIAKIFIHDKYEIGSNHHDVAILKVVGRIEYNDAIRPVCLPINDMHNNTFEHMQPYIAGWGRLAYGASQSSRLRHVQLEVESNEICRITYSVITQIRSNQLCAGYKPGGKDACQGDSGGPLVIPVNNTWYAIGVVSVGIKCAEPGLPGIFTRTSAYIDWIRDIITNRD